MTLERYQKKRSFVKTPEPEGQTSTPSPRNRSDLPIFVVQEHAATRLHFDLRLEVHGVLKSWAVPKGPTLNPSETRLAIMVEDHPLEYAQFEGVIPKGQYGAGTVKIWDHGVYCERSANTRQITEENIATGLKKGHITFLLFGDKLKGEFALVKTQDKKKPNHWLLIKKRDQYASHKANLAVRSPRRNPPSQVKTRTRSAKVSKLPRQIFKSMRPVLQTEDLLAVEWQPNAWMAEYDFGGWLKNCYLLAVVDDGEVRFLSSRNTEIKSIPNSIKSALGQLPDAVIEGEVVTQNHEQIFLASDLLFLNGLDLRSKTYDLRYKQLLKLPCSKHLTVKSALVLKNKTIDEGFLSLLLADLKDIAPQAIRIRAIDDQRSTGIAKNYFKFKAPTPRKTFQAESEVKISHPDKIMIPELALRKKDLVNYYQKIAPWILPYLTDRPMSLNRHPHGIHQPGFYQKDLTGYVPKYVERLRIFSESAQKSIDYPLCQNLESLLYFVNLGCIELNPWLSRKGSLDSPDILLIDLDPDGNSFKEVVIVALEFYQVLSKMKFPCFVKTSGGEGIHIYVPIKPKRDFDYVREIAFDICKNVQPLFPQLTSLERTPAKRRGKIYLDFMQNRRGQTIAAPYCLRPTPQATVSTPLRWEELPQVFSPGQFNIQTIFSRLATYGDLWSRLFASAIEI